MWITLLIAVWIISTYLNAGFVYAHFHRKYASLDSAENRAEDMAFSIGISLIPILSWIVTFFCTGFYFHGWLRPGASDETVR